MIIKYIDVLLMKKVLLKMGLFCYLGEEEDWIEMEQKLKKGRHLHTAFLVPDKFTSCS
jgi:hypothetical protein